MLMDEKNHCSKLPSRYLYTEGNAKPHNSRKPTFRKVDVEQPNEIGDVQVESEETEAVDENKQTTYGKLFHAAFGPLEEYCSNSTLHGVRYFVERKRHWVERFWWIVGFAISICCCGALIHKIYVNWEQKSVIISIAEKEMPVWDIPFPAVTICPSIKVALYDGDRYLERTGIDYTPGTFAAGGAVLSLDSQITLAYKIIDEKLKIQRAISNLCDYQIENGNLIDNSIIETLQMVMPQSPTSIYSCVFDNNNTDFCKFEKILTDHGICFTFNMLNIEETYVNGSIYSHIKHNKMSQWSSDHGYDLSFKNASQIYPYRLFGSGADGRKLQLFLEGDEQQRYKNIYNCHAPGFYVVLHTPGEIPQVSKYAFYLSPNIAAQVALRPNIITTSEDLKSYHPDRRNCYFNADRKLRFLRVYTQRNCELECLANFTLTVCGCVRFYMPRDERTPICGIGKSNCYKWAQSNLLKGQMKKEYTTKEWENRRLRHLVDRCRCLPTCNSITYDMEVSRNTEGYDLVDLRIFFKERKFITLVRSERYGPIDFIANCGGLLGLFIGASFLSIVELFYYFSLRLYCKSQANKK